MRFSRSFYAALGAGALVAACREAPTTTLGTPSFSALGTSSASVVNVSRDTTSQSETPLADNPAIVNSEPYGGGWLIRIAPADPGELSRLMDSAAYGRMVEEQHA